MDMIGGFFGLIILVLDVLAIFNIFSNKSLSGSLKILWIAVIVFLPVLGLVLWFFIVGPKPQTYK